MIEVFFFVVDFRLNNYVFFIISKQSRVPIVVVNMPRQIYIYIFFFLKRVLDFVVVVFFSSNKAMLLSVDEENTLLWLFFIFFFFFKN